MITVQGPINCPEKIYFFLSVTFSSDMGCCESKEERQQRLRKEQRERANRLAEDIDITLKGGPFKPRAKKCDECDIGLSRVNWYMSHGVSVNGKIPIIKYWIIWDGKLTPVAIKVSGNEGTMCMNCFGESDI